MFLILKYGVRQNFEKGDFMNSTHSGKNKENTIKVSLFKKYDESCAGIIKKHIPRTPFTICIFDDLGDLNPSEVETIASDIISKGCIGAYFFGDKSHAWEEEFDEADVRYHILNEKKYSSESICVTLCETDRAASRIRRIIESDYELHDISECVLLFLGGRFVFTERIIRCCRQNKIKRYPRNQHHLSFDFIEIGR